MPEPIRLCLAFHNHQPVGNFDFVFEQAYQDSYLPFLDVFEPYDALKISLHTSGPLLEWLDRNHGEYLDRIAKLVQAGRIEILGGAFYEPILTMIPKWDRMGQITSFTNWLENRLGAQVRGMWMPERVWEQTLTTDLASANIDFTILDDFHFKNAGLSQDQLYSYYVTEDEGNLLNVFPGSEQLRYLIPFSEPHESIDYLRGVAEQHPGAVMVFGDDGEKFGTWPDTKQHVYDNGWLRQFFDQLVANKDWLKTSTLTDAIENSAPIGSAYIPEGSYREMTEWALPVPRQNEYDHLSHDMQQDARWPTIKQFVRGGYWRNFKVKYPETKEMYSRMMMVSRRLQAAIQHGHEGDLIEAARTELYRGQCNCSYWHGAFGGTYLPHLRNAIFNHLIAADNLLDKATGKPAEWVEATARDYNFDARPEVLLVNDKLLSLVSPSAGGHLYELDVRSICHNLGATLDRRPEAYHQKVQSGPTDNEGSVASIHDRVVFKQEGLDQRLQYDTTPRKSLVDRFYADGATVESVENGQAEFAGGFESGEYVATVRRSETRVQVQLMREANVFGHDVRVTKGITLEAGKSSLEISYLLEGLPTDRTLHFGTEFNFAGLPSGADDRYFTSGQHRLGQLGARLNLNAAQELGLTDEWLGIDVRFEIDQPTNLWTFPVETVSQSEGGFELVHQSVAVLPHWIVRGDEDGRWSNTMRLSIDTSKAESRRDSEAATASV